MIFRTQIPPIVLGTAAVAAFYGWAVVATTPSHPGAIGININTLGNEWMVFWGAVQWLFDGRLDGLYDGERFTAFLNTTFAAWLSEPMSFRPWVYPPTYLLVVLPFGVLPFFTSYLVFQLITAGLLAAAVYRRDDPVGSRVLVVCGSLFGPAAAMNFGAGENAFLTAALLVGGVRLLPDRPVAAGLVLSLLTVKPQFAILAPIVLLAMRQWRALLWSAAGAVALVLASVAVAGIDPWRQWFGLAFGGYWQAGATWVAAGRIWGTSVYGALFASGLPSDFANAGQAVATLAAAGLTYAAFRRPAPASRAIAVLLACAILAAPHVSLIDLVLLSVAAALWGAGAAERETPLAQWTLALSLWIAMLFNPPLASPPGRFTPLLILGFACMALHRTYRPLSAPVGDQAQSQPTRP